MRSTCGGAPWGDAPVSKGPNYVYGLRLYLLRLSKDLFRPEMGMSCLRHILGPRMGPLKLEMALPKPGMGSFRPGVGSFWPGVGPMRLTVFFLFDIVFDNSRHLGK